MKQFRQWGASKQAEFKDDARMVIISADQNRQFGKYFGGDSAVFVIKRYKNNIARVKMVLHEGNVRFLKVSKIIILGRNLETSFQSYKKILEILSLVLHGRQYLTLILHKLFVAYLI